MPKRQKAASGSEDDYDLSDDSFVVEDDDYEDKPKKKKPAAKKKADDGEEKKKPKKPKAPPPPPNPTEPTTYEDGWTVHPPSLIYKANPAAQGGTKIAGIDLDGTLITRKSGAAFAVDANDWQFFNSEVIPKVKQAVNDGYQVVIFSNQGGIGKALLGKNSIKIRSIADSVLSALEAEGIYAQVLMATLKDNLRKPDTGMWDFFVAHLNQGINPNEEESFYVGDAAGRAGDIGDNADSDKVFAENLGIKFYAPEEYFGEKQTGPSVNHPANAGMAAAFHELGTLLKDRRENFKANTFLNLSKLVSDKTEPVTSSKDFNNVRGVGPSSKTKIDEYIRTGKLSAIDDIKGAAVQEEEKVSKTAAMALPFL